MPTNKERKQSQEFRRISAAQVFIDARPALDLALQSAAMLTPITRQDILAHQAVVPRSAQHQIEQDLSLCRAMVAVFDDDFLSTRTARRGGPFLHKIHLAPASRYSADIDLVVGTRPEEHNRRVLRLGLAEVLGVPKKSAWDTLKLALRIPSNLRGCCA